MCTRAGSGIANSTGLGYLTAIGQWDATSQVEFVMNVLAANPSPALDVND
jgi:hypothetical protein